MTEGRSESGAERIRLLAIVGSLRKKSLNRALVENLRGVLPADVSLDVFDGLGSLPLFNSDIPLETEPAPVGELKQAIRAADGLVFATPEYNYSLPGVLKNAIDWASRPPATSVLRGKPVGIVGVAAGMSGSIRAQQHLRQIFLYTESHALLQPEVLVARGHERFDPDGKLTDAPTRAILGTFAVALAAWVRRMKPVYE